MAILVTGSRTPVRPFLNVLLRARSFGAQLGRCRSHKDPLSRPSANRQAHGQCRNILTTSFAQGPTNPPLLTQTVPQHFATVVSAHGDRPAVHSYHQHLTLSYEHLNRLSNALAIGLEKLGVRKGDRVAVSLGNNAEYAVTTYALFKLGAILVPLNPAFTAEQVGAALRHLDAAWLVIGAETNLPRRAPRSNLDLLGKLGIDVGAAHARNGVQSEVVPSLRGVVMVDNAAGRINVSQDVRCAMRYEDVLEDGGDGQRAVVKDLHPDEIVNIQFTSGTTSMPKAAALMHKSILNNGASIGDRMLLTPDDAVCCPPPLFHCFGCILGYMATATHGSAIVFPSEAFDALATLKAVQEYRCTALYGVPTMFIAELELLASGAVDGSVGFERLRTGIAAGSSVPTELMKKLHRILNLTELTICYGMTETSPVSAMTTTDDPIEKRVATVGRLLPHVTAKVVDPTNKKTVLGIGERGELAVSGYLVMNGYWGDKEKTDEVLVKDEKGNIFMLTGDEAIMDAEGYVTITGRIKDIIIRGGENIHPLDIENCLLTHDAVENVSCTGIPDERYGEVVAVFVVKRKGAEVTEDELKAWVGDKLARHFVPKHVFWTDDFPKTPSGKVQRFKLKDEAVARLKEEV